MKGDHFAKCIACQVVYFIFFADILMEYNPDLRVWSYSRDPGIGEDRNKTHCGNALPCSELNVAEPGGTNR